MSEGPDESVRSDEGGIELGSLLVTVLSVALTVYFWHQDFTLWFLIAGTAVISIVIWQACDPFAEAAQWVGRRYHLPGSVRGATLDAVASSIPELFSGIFFVVVAARSAGSQAAMAEACGEGYGSSIATCAGSAIYNMILIPAVCAIVISIWRRSRPTIDIEAAVVRRDGVYFLVCEALLLVCLYQNKMYWWMGAGLLSLYLVYIVKLQWDARAYRRANNLTSHPGGHTGEAAPVFFGFFRVPLNGTSVWLVLLTSTAVAAAACYFLVETVHATADTLGVPAFFVAVILAAAASSVPDMFVSIGAARRGDDSGAVSNAFGSNIFDICVCLSVPLLLACYLNQWEPISLLQDGKPLAGLVGLRVLLWVLTLITLLIIWHKRRVTRTKAVILCALYGVFIAYAVLGSLGVSFYGYSL